MPQIAEDFTKYVFEKFPLMPGFKEAEFFTEERLQAIIEEMKDHLL
jgi:hypothetical protein